MFLINKYLVSIAYAFLYDEIIRLKWANKERTHISINNENTGTDVNLETYEIFDKTDSLYEQSMIKLLKPLWRILNKKWRSYSRDDYIGRTNYVLIYSRNNWIFLYFEYE